MQYTKGNKLNKYKLKQLNNNKINVLLQLQEVGLSDDEGSREKPVGPLNRDVLKASRGPLPDDLAIHVRR